MSNNRLLFVHGWATDSRVWSNVAVSFGSRSAALDLPGHGGPGRWDSPTMEPAVKAIRERVEGMDGGLIGVGWSLGAEALMAAHGALEGRFKALVLIGATPCFVERDGFPWGQPRALVRRMILDMKKDPAATVDRFYALNFTDDETGVSHARAFMERYRYPGPVSCEGERPGCMTAFRYDEITAALEALYSTDLTGILPLLDIPVLLVHGSDDRVCPIGAARETALRLPDARLEVFDAAGHAPFITSPERFTALLMDFMDSLG